MGAIKDWARHNRLLTVFAVILVVVFVGSFLCVLAVLSFYTFGVMNDRDATTLATALAALGTICGAIGTIAAVIVALWLAGASERRENERRRRLDIGVLVALREELARVHRGYTAEIIERYPLPVWHEVYREIGVLNEDLTRNVASIAEAVKGANALIEANRRYYDEHQAEYDGDQRMQIEIQLNNHVREQFQRPIRDKLFEAIRQIEETLTRLRD